MTKTPKKPLTVVGGHHRPKPAIRAFRSIPPATTPEERTAFAVAVAAHLPGRSWHLDTDVPETVTFEARFSGTRREYEYTGPIRVLRGGDADVRLLLAWTFERADKHGHFIVSPEDLYVCALLTDASTPEAVGKAIAFADGYDNRHVLEHNIYRGRLENRSAHLSPVDRGTGWNEETVAASIAEWLPDFLKQRAAMQAKLAEVEKNEAKRAKEIADRIAYREHSEAAFQHGTAQLTALGFYKFNSYPASFYVDPADIDDKPNSDVVLEACHRKHRVTLKVTVRVSQLPTLLPTLGYRMPTRAQKAKAKKAAAAHADQEA